MGYFDPHTTQLDLFGYYILYHVKSLGHAMFLPCAMPSLPPSRKLAVWAMLPSSSPCELALWTMFLPCAMPSLLLTRELAVWACCRRRRCVSRPRGPSCRRVSCCRYCYLHGNAIYRSTTLQRANFLLKLWLVRFFGHIPFAEIRTQIPTYLRRVPIEVFVATWQDGESLKDSPFFGAAAAVIELHG